MNGHLFSDARLPARSRGRPYFGACSPRWKTGAGTHSRSEFIEQEAKDRLWRREVNKVGGVGHYVHTNNPGPNTLIIDRYENFEGIAVVLAARFSPTISPLNAKHLAELAIDSARRVGDGRDGITYLVEAKLNGIITPLCEEFEREILTRRNARDLEEAVHKVQR